MQENKEILQASITDFCSSLAKVEQDAARNPQNHVVRRPSSSRSAMTEAICRLEAISEALDEMTSQLKNVSPEVSSSTGVFRELASCLCASYRVACDNWADYHASGAELMDATSKMHIHRGLVELGHECTELMYAAVASARDLTASAFPAACSRVLDKVSGLERRRQ